MSDDVPAWPAAPLLQRLKECRIMLFQHGILTFHEADQADKRIDRLEANLKRGPVPGERCV